VVENAWAVKTLSGIGRRAVAVMLAVLLLVLVPVLGNRAAVSAATPPSPLGHPSYLKCTVWGGAGNDTLVGTSGNDVICGQAGNDVVRGRGGRDRLYGVRETMRSTAATQRPAGLGPMTTSSTATKETTESSPAPAPTTCRAAPGTT
jgi:RTX calcium-binding nonapeptide repeat (4 copies)